MSERWRETIKLWLDDLFLGSAKPDRGRPDLQYFDGVLAVERDAINVRRRKFGRGRVAPTQESERRRRAVLSDDATRRQATATGGGRVNVAAPDPKRMRPLPEPCDATGLALSGGGIRSAAVCLGALQALHQSDRIGSIDYLSTVSGGGYIGCCLSAALSQEETFPFGEDVADCGAVSHLRNYSNYLMPRGVSQLRSAAEITAIFLRGVLANTLVVGWVVLLAGLVLASLYYVLYISPEISGGKKPLGYFPITIILSSMLALILTVWAIGRSLPTSYPIFSDTCGIVLVVAQILIVDIVLCFIIELMLFFMYIAPFLQDGADGLSNKITAGLAAFLGGLTGLVSLLSGPIGQFLKSSERSSGFKAVLSRVAMKLGLWLLALTFPLILGVVALRIALAIYWDSDGSTVLTVVIVGLVAFLIHLTFSGNGYTLHRLYRDRLSKAFLFTNAEGGGEPKPQDELKLSELSNSGPYHIINAAMNVQGSKEANRRGREADFFIFSRHFVGSDLSHYALTQDLVWPRPYEKQTTMRMESIDPELDLATAMAISGAAVSANMGSNTIRLLSPMLAFFNLRLGYWIRNPRNLARVSNERNAVSVRIDEYFFLLKEFFNKHDELGEFLYLTDGGHIENLGVYELLKRGCTTVLVVDAEADPHLAFPSLLKLERYARIDLGVRIVLPWEEIADACVKVAADVAAGRRPRLKGPHCAVGRIFYADGSEGVLAYFKASVTGDEKDYILDYKRRNEAFPHETTGDQFFSEEQFEMYRSLGFHIVNSFFNGRSRVAYLTSREENAFQSEEHAIEEVERAIRPAWNKLGK